HQLRIAHRDIKLENVLIDKSLGIKLIDFGFALESSDRLKSFCGTPSYMAPEMVLKKGYDGRRVDVWALGVLLYRLVVGAMPFKGADEKALFGKILHGVFKLPAELSRPLASLLTGMLRKNPRSG
ncbi:uncharacterized protein LOC127594979, partial [Hippocampus zosterae]|uniref:uncharacterized protein LOC127594979 n=1 Tax=Hippocampus zosterae TaxID=109293 RepID=UPI00223CDC24